MWKFKLKKERGITLVALVVTIVVLLILAGVTITTLFGDNGIIKKAQDAKEATENAQKNTIIQLEELEEEMNKALGQYTLKDIIETINFYYTEEKNNGNLETDQQKNKAFYAVQDKINNSKYKDKLINLEGTLVYIGDDENEKKLMKNYEIETDEGENTRIQIIKSIIENEQIVEYTTKREIDYDEETDETIYTTITRQTHIIKYEEGFILINPKTMWGTGESSRITETELKQLLTNSNEEIEQSKISFEYSNSSTEFSGVKTGLKIYYNNIYIGTIVAYCDGDGDGMVGTDDLSALYVKGVWKKDVREATISTDKIKALDANIDGVINEEDKELMFEDVIWKVLF